MADLTTADPRVDAVASALYRQFTEDHFTEEWADWEQLGDQDSWRERARVAIVAMPDDRASIVTYLETEALKRRGWLKLALNVMAGNIKAGMDRE